MKHVTVLITDLDNTLCDWFDIWHTCFCAMLERIAAKRAGIENGKHKRRGSAAKRRSAQRKVVQ